jgi:hypothetical protein
MGIAPKKPLDLISFYRERSKPSGPWPSNETVIGTTTGMVTGVYSAVGLAQAAYDAAQAARAASRISRLRSAWSMRT